MRFGEDIDFSYRIVEAGYTTALIPDAYVYHKRRTDFRKFFRQVHNSGMARITVLGTPGGYTPSTPLPSNLPQITKNPTDETVNVNGKCQFVTRYENAIYAEWHFVSPDGYRDLDYSQAQTEFPTLKVINGFTKDLTLEDIPAALNGWKVYCRFSNNAGAVNSGMARITVVSTAPTSAPTPSAAQATGRIMTVYYANGATESVAEFSDTTWRTSIGLVYYLGTDGVLRARGAADLYTYYPVGG